MEFLDHLPPNCPPLNAKFPAIEVYYLVDSDPPSAKDFISFREKRPDKNFDNDPVLICQASGLSVYTDLNGINLAKRVSRSLQKKRLAKGTLTKNSGKIKNTPSKNTGDTHHTWWPSRDVDPCLLFHVLP